MDTLPGGVQQLQPGLGQGLGRRAAWCRRQVLGDAFHEDKPAEGGGRCERRSHQPASHHLFHPVQAEGAGRALQARLGRAGLTPRSTPGRGLSGGPESREVGAQAHPKPRCCLLRAAACGARQRCWVWAPAAVEALGDAQADPEGRAGPVGVGGMLGVCWDSRTPQRGGRGGGCDSTPGRTGASGLVGVSGWQPAFAAKSAPSRPRPRPHSGPYSSRLLPLPRPLPLPHSPPSPEPASSNRRWQRAMLIPLGSPRGKAGSGHPADLTGSLTGRSRSADAAGPPLPGVPRPSWSQGPETWWALPRGARGPRWRERALATARR